MTPPVVDRVGVVGSVAIAEVCLQAGSNVVLVEPERTPSDSSARRCSDKTGPSLHVTDDVAVLADADLVIDARNGREADIIKSFSKLACVTEAGGAILATNSTVVHITTLSAATTSPERVIGMHFVRPVPIGTVVEVTPSLATSSQTIHRVEHYVTDVLCRRVLRAPDHSGLLVNSLLLPLLLSAIRIVEAGHASPDDVDAAMTQGCAHPIGPLALADLAGLDRVKELADSLYRESKNPHLAPPPLLLRMVEGGLLGRKSGQGFFRYPM